MSFCGGAGTLTFVCVFMYFMRMSRCLCGHLAMQKSRIHCVNVHLANLCDEAEGFSAGRGQC